MSTSLGSGRIRSHVLRDIAGRLIILLLAFAVSGEAAAQRGPRGAAPEAASGPAAHAKVLEEDRYPSASKCGSCHQQIYDEWRVSNHAYAGISPMFHKFEQKVTELAPTIGSFCVRCHMSVATELGEARDLPLWKRSQVSREGVTCISCHRVADEYGKANGERHIAPGSIFEPVYGPLGGDGVASVVQNAGRYNVATDAKGRGAKIHTTGVKFAQISQSEFCVSCHQVAVNVGIKLEVVWDQYRASPARKQGVTCQDCHMGKVPGKAEGYATGPVADGMRNGRTLNPARKRTNHSFYGPGYPIAHPGVFPHHNTEGTEDWSMERWLKFDYRAKWGSDDFEAEVESGKRKLKFPEEWAEAEDRKKAWSVVEENQKLLELKKEQRRQVMDNGSRIDGPFFTEAAAGRPLRFSYRVTNTNSGHNMPSGSLGAQPEIWLNVALIGPDGKRLWESGYLDSIGDMADLHSLDVRAGKVKHDGQLFNLQTKFLTTNVKGTDREMYLPFNLDIDQLPMLRPAGQPVSVMNHPPFVRMESRSLPPLGSRSARYTVPAELIAKPGKYKLAVRLRSRAEPIYFMRFVGATLDMERSMNEWMLDIHPYTVEFQVKE